MARDSRTPDQTLSSLPGKAPEPTPRWLQGNLSQVKDLSDRITELSTLMGISALVSSELPLSEVLEQVCRLTAEICKADVAFVHLSDEDGDLVCLARYGSDDPLRYGWEGIARIYGRKAVSSGKMASRSSLLLSAPEEATSCGNSRMGGVCSVPLKGRARIVGAIAIGYSRVHRFSAREKDVLSAISAQLAMAVERSWLFDQLQEQLARAHSLREVANRISSNLRLDLVLDSIVDHASKLLAAEFSAILLADSPATGPAGGPGRLRGGSLQLDEGPMGSAVGRALQTGSVAISQGNPPDSVAGSISDLKLDEYRVALAVPLLAGDEVLGALVFCYLEARKFDDSDIARAEDFAGQAALAISNARLYEDAMQNRLSLEAAINQINDHGISLMDEDFNVRFANPATFRLLGVEPRKGSIPAKEWAAMLKRSLPDGAGGNQLIDRIREHPEETIEVDLRSRGGSDNIRTVRLLSRPLRQSDGSISGRVNLLEEE